MSVTTYHEVTNETNDLFDRLKKDGVIHPGMIYSPRRHEYVNFRNVFDYRMCDMETLKELNERVEKNNKWYREELEKNKDLSPEERDYHYVESLKCDPYLMPVFKTKNGGVFWELNYAVDQLPSVAIGRKYPEEVFEYFEETEGTVYSHVKYKKDTDIENLLKKREMEEAKANLSPDEKEDDVTIIRIRV